MKISVAKTPDMKQSVYTSLSETISSTLIVLSRVTEYFCDQHIQIANSEQFKGGHTYQQTGERYSFLNNSFICNCAVMQDT